MLSLSAALLMGVMFGAFTPKDMKLIHNKTDQPVIEFNAGKPTFYDRFLEKSIVRNGITIPPALKDEFGGKEVVRVGDKEFERAFVEVFYKMSMNSDLYHWEE